MKGKKIHLVFSRVLVIHYCKFIFRFGFLVVAAIIYFRSKINGIDCLPFGFGKCPIVFAIWLIFIFEEILRFFPSSYESRGCQKQFLCNFYPQNIKKKGNLKSQSIKSILIIMILWLMLNSLVGVLFITNVIDEGALLLVCLFYSVCDMICILFFCPFQVWIMKNKCCISYRIYNWDFIMIFAPLVFIRNVYTWSLLGLAFILFVKWEMVYYLYPERFSESTNASLSCSVCREKLCKHKQKL